MAYETRACHAVGVPHRNCTAAHIEAVIRDAQLVAAIQDLHCKRFVQFPETNIADFKSGLFSSFGTAYTGPIPISSGSHPAT